MTKPRGRCKQCGFPNAQGGLKQCRVCGEVKAVDSFYPRPGNSDGNECDCIECMSAASRSRYRANAEVYRARAREAQRAGRRRAGAKRRTPAECGTNSGAQRHRRANEPLCPACRLAESAHNREKYVAAQSRGRTCEVDGCEHPYYAKGQCNMHWKRARKVAS